MIGNGVRRSCFQVLGVRVDAVQIQDVCRILEHWIQRRHRCRYVAVTGMHGMMEARHDPSFRAILNSADLVVPDGMPLVWLGRLRGMDLPRRVYGPELMLSVCQQTSASGSRHFLLGGAPGVSERLASALQNKFPGLRIAGTCSPPFRPLTKEEDEELVASINRASPDVVWVGLSTPKQERWMYQHRDHLNAAVILGVGAAFDIHSGTKKQAPSWMREGGLEWLFRLFQEPRRLWWRYLVYGPKFVLLAALELFGLRRF